MTPSRNVGGLDRTVRGVLGTSLVVAALAAILAGRRTAGLLAVAAGAGLLVNWATGFCGANALLGIDTCPDSEES